jgi:hypothetical protein
VVRQEIHDAIRAIERADDLLLALLEVADYGEESDTFTMEVGLVRSKLVDVCDTLYDLAE